MEAWWREELLDGLVEDFSTTEDILEREEFNDEEAIGEIELIEIVEYLRLPIFNRKVSELNIWRIWPLL